MRRRLALPALALGFSLGFPASVPLIIGQFAASANETSARSQAVSGEPYQEPSYGHSGASLSGTVRLADLPELRPSGTSSLRTAPRILAPPGFSIPGDAVFRPAATLASSSSTPQSSTSIPDFSVADNFLALADDGTTIPPDSQGAVGPSHLMVTLNSQISIQSRSGSPLHTYSMKRFWQQVYPQLTDIFDPRLVFDPYGGRWIFAAVAERQSPNSVIIFAASRTNDPTGEWELYSIQADSSGQTWADNPVIGFNQKSLLSKLALD